jgi:hypothetical protein
MFNILKSRPKDVKSIRGAILTFIKEQLQNVEGGEGGNIKGLTLYVQCNAEERYLYEGAVYYADESRFKTEEIQKIADDFAIALPDNWTLDIVFVNQLPPDAVRAEKTGVALLVHLQKKQAPITQVFSKVGSIKILKCEAEKAAYTIKPQDGKVNIGREKKTATADGFVRENHIAFLAESNHDGNKSVSRQHCHIQWDDDAKSFLIFADEGGIPPYNKTKVKSKDGLPVKIQTTGIGYRLHNGDQIILGESAVLEFTLG